MLIYQIHQETGEYEDFKDEIISSYLREDRAKEELEKLEEKAMILASEVRKCKACDPYEFGNRCADYVKSEHSYYYHHCKSSKAYYDVPQYYIDVVEVEE